jgi:hypothetical protein
MSVFLNIRIYPFIHLLFSFSNPFSTTLCRPPQYPPVKSHKLIHAACAWMRCMCMNATSSSTRSARPSSHIAVAPARSTPSAHSQEEQSKLPCKPASLLCPAARNRRRHGSTDLINSKPSERRRGSIRGMLEITNCNLHSGSNRRSDRTQQYVVPHEHVHTLPYACTCAVQPRPSASVCRPFNIHMQASARRRCSASPTD